MVASGIAEIVNLGEMTNDLVADNGIWLGGFLKGDQWVWITGEPWKTAKWIKGSVNTDPDSALIILPGKGWDARNLADSASGFIIEWSNDRKSATAPEIKAVAPAEDTSGLLTRAKALIVSAEAKRGEKLADNARKFSWDLDVFMRGLSKGGQSTWGAHVERLKLCIKDNRVPSAVPKSSGINLSEKMAELAQFHSQQQDKIDAEFTAEAEKIRVAFVAKLRDSGAQAKASGQSKVAESIEDSINKAGDLASWVRSFGVELQPRNPVADKPLSVAPDKTSPAPPPPGDGGLQIE